MPGTRLIRFDARLIFSLGSLNKAYTRYDEVSIAEEKVDIARKILQRKQLGCLAGRIGL